MLANHHLARFARPLAGAALVLLLVTGCDRSREPAQAEPAEPKTQASASVVQTNMTAPEELRPVIKRVLGRWIRADGGYRLEINAGNNAGQLQAAYFNPRPINVSKAMAIVEGEKTKVFIELQDIGYPGCTYTLLYDPQTDQLFGQYYQAAQVQTYDVTFERARTQPQP